MSDPLQPSTGYSGNFMLKVFVFHQVTISSNEKNDKCRDNITAQM